MSDENNRNDEEKEPIESIEKTVEDLKRKIEEISAEDKAEAEAEDSKEDRKLNIPDFKLDDDSKKKIEDIKSSTIETVNKSIDEIKKKGTEVANSKEVRDTIAFLKENAIKAVDAAKAKITELKTDPQVQKKFSDAKEGTSEAFKNGVDYAGKKLNEAAGATKSFFNEKLSDPQNADLKKKIDEASAAAQKGFNEVNKSIGDFMKKPEVAETIDKAKDATVDLAKKGAQALEDWLKPEAKDAPDAGQKPEENTENKDSEQR